MLVKQYNMCIHFLIDSRIVTSRLHKFFISSIKYRRDLLHHIFNLSHALYNLFITRWNIGSSLFIFVCITISVVCIVSSYHQRNRSYHNCTFLYSSLHFLDFSTTFSCLIFGRYLVSPRIIIYQIRIFPILLLIKCDPLRWLFTTLTFYAFTLTFFDAYPMHILIWEIISQILSFYWLGS